MSRVDERTPPPHAGAYGRRAASTTLNAMAEAALRPRLVLEIDVGEGLTALVPDGEAGFLLLDRPRGAGSGERKGMKERS